MGPGSTMEASLKGHRLSLRPERGSHNQDMAITSKRNEVLATREYFRVDYQERLPKSEVQRRQSIRESLERQYEHWKVYEQRGRYQQCIFNKLL